MAHMWFARVNINISDTLFNDCQLNMSFLTQTIIALPSVIMESPVLSIFHLSQMKLFITKTVQWPPDITCIVTPLHPLTTQLLHSRMTNKKTQEQCPLSTALRTHNVEPYTQTPSDHHWSEPQLIPDQPLQLTMINGIQWSSCGARDKHLCPARVGPSNSDLDMVILAMTCWAGTKLPLNQRFHCQLQQDKSQTTASDCLQTKSITMASNRLIFSVNTIQYRQFVLHQNLQYTKVKCMITCFKALENCYDLMQYPVIMTLQSLLGIHSKFKWTSGKNSAMSQLQHKIIVIRMYLPIKSSLQLNKCLLCYTFC